MDNPHTFGYPPPPLLKHPALPLTSPMNDDEDHVMTSTENSPRAVEIMPEEQDKEEENTPSEDSLVLFYTADTHNPGMQQNPIDIDLTPEQPINPLLRPTGVRQTQSAPTTIQCTVCA